MTLWAVYDVGLKLMCPTVAAPTWTRLVSITQQAYCHSICLFKLLNEVKRFHLVDPTLALILPMTSTSVYEGPLRVCH